MSWYETGTDDNLGVVGRTDRPREHYETALRWIREECDNQNIFLSLVMLHLKSDLGLKSLLAVSIPPHGCKIYCISATPTKITSPQSQPVHLVHLSGKRYAMTGAGRANIKQGLYAARRSTVLCRKSIGQSISGFE